MKTHCSVAHRQTAKQETPFSSSPGNGNRCCFSTASHARSGTAGSWLLPNIRLVYALPLTGAALFCTYITP